MKTVAFNCNGRFSPAYTCSEPGDMSGFYVRHSDAYSHAAEREKQARREALEGIANWIEPQRNDVPATGEEFAAAIRQLIEEEG